MHNVYNSEACIRLNKFDEAYSNCQETLKFTHQSKTNFNKLMEITCYYNMAIIRYKQNNLMESIVHFQRFFELAKSFCYNFLERSLYEKLFKENIFEIPKNESQIETCLQNSLKIFSAIYGENHSFVRNYVIKNSE